MAEKTSALPRIIKRGISEPTEESKFDKAIMPGIVRMIFCILRRCGIEYDNNQIRIAEENMKNVLSNGRKVLFTKKTGAVVDEGSDDFADRIARYMVSRIAVAVEEAKSPVDPSSFLMTTPTVINKDQSALLTALISKRQMHHLSAKRASVTAKVALDKLSSSQHSSGAIANGGDNGVQNDPLLAIVDITTKEKFEQNKIQLENLKVKVQEVESEKLKALRSTADSLEAERLTAQEKIAELKATLIKLEAQDEELAFKLGSVEGDIAQEQIYTSNQTKELNQTLEKTKEEVQYANSVIDFGRNVEVVWSIVRDGYGDFWKYSRTLHIP